MNTDRYRSPLTRNSKKVRTWWFWLNLEKHQLHPINACKGHNKHCVCDSVHACNNHTKKTLNQKQISQGNTLRSFCHSQVRVLVPSNWCENIKLNGGYHSSLTDLIKAVTQSPQQKQHQNVCHGQPYCQMASSLDLKHGSSLACRVHTGIQFKKSITFPWLFQGTFSIFHDKRKP